MLIYADIELPFSKKITGNAETVIKHHVPGISDLQMDVPGFLYVLKPFKNTEDSEYLLLKNDDTRRNRR